MPGGSASKRAEKVIVHDPPLANTRSPPLTVRDANRVLPKNSSNVCGFSSVASVFEETPIEHTRSDGIVCTWHHGPS